MSDRPDDTEPSAEALEVARELVAALGNTDGNAVPFPDDVQTAALALDRFRAAGVRDGVQQGLRIALEQITIPTSGNKARSLGYASRIRRLISEPPHDR